MTPFAIEYPSPFIEIFNHVGYVDAEHLPALPGGCRMLMHDRDRRDIHRLPAFMDSARDVYIFGIHEEAFVEEAAITQRVITEEQKAT